MDVELKHAAKASIDQLAGDERRRVKSAIGRLADQISMAEDVNDLMSTNKKLQAHKVEPGKLVFSLSIGRKFKLILEFNDNIGSIVDLVSSRQIDWLSSIRKKNRSRIK